jgi:hypothetical protein
LSVDHLEELVSGSSGSFCALVDPHRRPSGAPDPARQGDAQNPPGVNRSPLMRTGRIKIGGG